MRLVLMVIGFFIDGAVFANVPLFTVLNQQDYEETLSFSRKKIESILKKAAISSLSSADNHIAFITEQLLDAPYLFEDAMGEGDWQANSPYYQPGALHINQHPVYRLDGFNCQTFVQVAMALYYAKTQKEFDSHLIKISYGALANSKDAIHFYNRNHFVDADFNRVNQAQGRLQDITTSHPNSKLTSAILTRNQFFLLKQKQSYDTVAVLDKKNGNAMVERFKTQYQQLPKAFLAKQRITLSYFPKEVIAIRQKQGGFLPNKAFLDSILTPAIAEIVYDAKRWRVSEKPIATVLGTELNISHFGLLYRQTFSKGDVIYQKITCDIKEASGKRTCIVTPQICEKTFCHELMFSHATRRFPKGFYWYQEKNGQLTCSRSLPKSVKRYTTCNRVVKMPLFAYITDYQYGSYWYMNWPPILGVHIEKLLDEKHE